MKKRWKIGLVLRRILVIFLLLLEIALLGFVIFSNGKASSALQIISFVLGLILALKIAVEHHKSGYKTMWILLSLLFPILGIALYWLQISQLSTKRFGKRIEKIEKKTNDAFFYPKTAFEEIKKKSVAFIPQCSYLQNFARFPVYGNNETEYFSPGESFYEQLLVELEKAEKYIFLEYFIVEEGVMWDSILEILKRKAAVGVTVRLLYDDLGCFLTLPNAYPKILSQYGIECYKFNPFRPFLSTVQNNRDHRKIVAIDGRTAFTGGINLADEYINEYEKHGHWKDSAIMLKGSAAWSLTVMFLQMWEFVSKKTQDILSYYPSGFHNKQNNGYVQPYADSPMDRENVGEHVYLQIINTAKRYVYINTPYLIVDDAMVSALTLAAKSGIDVRIVTPYRWDKKIVHMTTRSYYRELLSAGVKIYEYTKGFMHSKTFVSDDTVATVGTTNLDYRSLYLHFECGVAMYNTKAVGQVKDDFLSTLEICHEIKLEDCKANGFQRLVQNTLRLFAPLM